VDLYVEVGEEQINELLGKLAPVPLHGLEASSEHQAPGFSLNGDPEQQCELEVMAPDVQHPGAVDPRLIIHDCVVA
jgi:hypothetical protein